MTISLFMAVLCAVLLVIVLTRLVLLFVRIRPGPPTPVLPWDDRATISTYSPPGSRYRYEVKLDSTGWQAWVPVSGLNRCGSYTCQDLTFGTRAQATQTEHRRRFLMMLDDPEFCKRLKEKLG